MNGVEFLTCFIWLRIGKTAGFCYCNKTLVPKMREFLNCLTTFLLLDSSASCNWYSYFLPTLIFSRQMMGKRQTRNDPLRQKKTAFTNIAQSSFHAICCYIIFVPSLLISSAFPKLRKATNSFVMSVHPHNITRFPLDGYSWNLIFEDFFRKSV